MRGDGDPGLFQDEAVLVADPLDLHPGHGSLGRQMKRHLLAGPIAELIGVALDRGLVGDHGPCGHGEHREQQAREHQGQRTAGDEHGFHLLNAIALKRHRPCLFLQLCLQDLPWGTSRSRL